MKSLTAIQSTQSKMVAHKNGIDFTTDFLTSWRGLSSHVQFAVVSAVAGVYDLWFSWRPSR